LIVHLQPPEGARLDRLAALILDNDLNVPELLAWAEEQDPMDTAQRSIRAPAKLFARAEALVEVLEDTPEAAAAGAQWKASAVLRLALALGLAELEKRAAGVSR